MALTHSTELFGADLVNSG